MCNTAWGEAITFSWELEGRGLEILRWFKPPGENTQQWLNATQYFRVGVFNDELHQRMGVDLSWADFVQVSGPGFIVLDNEVDPLTWELQCANGHYPTTLNQLFNQLDRINTAFPGAWAGFQVHIVFDLPIPMRAQYSWSLIGLYTLLNDYATAKYYARNKGSIQESDYGSVTVDLGTLGDQLQNGRPLEMLNDPNEANKVSGTKFNFVGLRTMYSTPTMVGLEIREGWSRNYGRFQSLIRRIVYTLEHMAPNQFVRIKRKFEMNGNDFTLENHLGFLFAPCASLGEWYDQALNTEALRLIVDRPQLGQPYPDTIVLDDGGQHLDLRVPQYRNGQQGFQRAMAEALVTRWRKALLLWENHPAFSNTTETRDAIIAARGLLVTSLQNYLQRIHNNPGQRDDDYVHHEVSWFFRITNLHRYL